MLENDRTILPEIMIILVHVELSVFSYFKISNVVFMNKIIAFMKDIELHILHFDTNTTKSI